MYLHKGSIIWANLPKTEGSVQYGTRPCLCMGNEKGLRNGSTVTVIPLTQHKKAMHLPVHVLIPKTILPKESVAMAEQITTISKAAVVQVVGMLDPAHLQAVEKAVKTQLGI